MWDPMTVTVGEHVVSEGLADAFARQLYGDELGYARIGVPSLHDDAVFAKVLTGLDVTGMQNFTAWVRGRQQAGRHLPDSDRADSGAGPARPQRGGHSHRARPLEERGQGHVALGDQRSEHPRRLTLGPARDQSGHAGQTQEQSWSFLIFIRW